MEDSLEEGLVKGPLIMIVFPQEGKETIQSRVPWGHPRALLKYRLHASLPDSLIQLTGVGIEASVFFIAPWEFDV